MQVTIESNEIGITVENVLERTVVHLVKEGSSAALQGVPRGALEGRGKKVLKSRNGYRHRSGHHQEWYKTGLRIKI